MPHKKQKGILLGAGSDSNQPC